MDEYTKKIYEQFKKSKGITIDNVDELFVKSYCLDVFYWLNERKKISYHYIDLLKKLKLPFDSLYCAEIGKGKHDTIVGPFKTKIFTPYTNGLEDLNVRSKRVTKIKEMYFDYSNVMLVYPNDSYQIIMQDIFMTQNFYSENELKNWEYLHNYNKNIIVGVYGNIFDCDKNEKIKCLESLKDRLKFGYNEEFVTIDDSYCYVLASKKIKTRGRFI